MIEAARSCAHVFQFSRRRESVAILVEDTEGLFELFFCISVLQFSLIELQEVVELGRLVINLLDPAIIRMDDIEPK